MIKCSIENATNRDPLNSYIKYNRVFDGHDQPTEIPVLKGYFLTDSELEAFARECFIAGETSKISCGTYSGCGNLQETFSDFWAQRKGRE